jgi:hypothetical protein
MQPLPHWIAPVALVRNERCLHPHVRGLPLRSAQGGQNKSALARKPQSRVSNPAVPTELPFFRGSLGIQTGILYAAKGGDATLPLSSYLSLVEIDRDFAAGRLNVKNLVGLVESRSQESKSKEPRE